MSALNELSIITCDCSHCGNCCKRCGELSLTPLDVFNISHYLGMSAKEFIEKYCDIGKGFDVCIRSNESTKLCIFFTRDSENGNFCKIYEVRPRTCYLYPLKPRLESRDAFFIDSAATCPTSGDKMSFSEYVEKYSNGRYDEDFTHFQRFCMAIGAFYSDHDSPSQSDMFEYLFYNDSAEEAKQKLEHYLFGK